VDVDLRQARLGRFTSTLVYYAATSAIVQPMDNASSTDDAEACGAAVRQRTLRGAGDDQRSRRSILLQIETGIQDTGRAGAIKVNRARMDFNGATTTKLLCSRVESQRRESGNGE
jgi:hypothetical protein